MCEDWSDRIEFRVPSCSRDEEVMLDFVNQHFVPNEPLNVAVNMCEPGYRMAWFDNFVRKYISEGYSLMAYDTMLQRLVGVAIFTQCKKSPEPSESSESSDIDRPLTARDELKQTESDEEPNRWEVMPVKFGMVLELLENLVGSTDLFNKYNVDRYLELFILCTHSTKRYPGLGTALTVEALKRAESKGFSLCVTEATSFFSQKIFTRLGFEVLKEVEFESYRPHGKVVFPKHGMHDTVKLMIKKI